MEKLEMAAATRTELVNFINGFFASESEYDSISINGVNIMLDRWYDGHSGSITVRLDEIEGYEEDNWFSAEHNGDFITPDVMEMVCDAYLDKVYEYAEALTDNLIESLSNDLDFANNGDEHFHGEELSNVDLIDGYELKTFVCEDCDDNNAISVYLRKIGDIYATLTIDGITEPAIGDAVEEIVNTIKIAA